MVLSWTLPMDRMLEEWLGDAKDRPEVAVPAADVLDDGEAYRIVMELPGVAKDGLELEVKDEVLRVRGRRPATETEGKVLLDGRRASRVFERHFTLGHDIDREGMRARLENGLLSIVLPRKAEVKPRRIEVEIG